MFTGIGASEWSHAAASGGIGGSSSLAKTCMWETAQEESDKGSVVATGDTAMK